MLTIYLSTNIREMFIIYRTNDKPIGVLPCSKLRIILIIFYTKLKNNKP